MIIIKTFNGYTLNNSDFRATAASAKNPPPATPIFIEQANTDQIYAGTFKIDVRSVVVTLQIIDAANRDTLEAQLKEACRPGTAGLLVGLFTDNMTDYQLTVVVQSIRVDKGGVWTIIFSTGESAWHAVTASTDSLSLTASGDKKDLTVGGYSPTRLNISITPTTLPATGYAYQRLYQLVNKAGYGYGIRPWCIALDTAALVTAGKMQADGDDIMVVVDGAVVNRWLGGMNTSATHIWFNLNLAAGQTLELLTAVASSGGITTLYFKKTANNKSALTALPGRGFVQHGTEWFEYTGKDTAKYTLTGVTRAALETTMQAHAAADSFAWIEHSIYLLYGNGSATAPALTDTDYDDMKPVFDLVNSDNDTWVYTGSTKFHDPDNPNRTGAWKPSVTKVGNVSDIYEIKQNAASGDPAMGMRIGTWYKSGIVKSEKATISWLLNHPGGISTVTTVGQKYRNTTLWPGTLAARLEKSSNGSTWAQVWSAATPTAEDTWEAVSEASASAGDKANVRFILTGTFAAKADTDAYFEVLTCTVEFVAANEPAGTLGTEVSNYLLDVTVKNNTTGDQLNLLFPMKLNTALVLDCEAYSVEYGGVNAANSLNLNDNSRSVWMRLNPNVTNEIEITGVNIAQMTVAFSWYNRRL